MTNHIRTALHDAAAAAEPYGDAARAIDTADRRRRTRLLGLSATLTAIVVIVVAGVTLSFDRHTPPATTHPTAPTTTSATGDPGAADVSMHGAEAPAALLYRTCGHGSCTVGLVDNNNQHLGLPVNLAAALATQDFDGVTLSTDGAWVGYPHNGEFTVVNVYDETLSLRLPAGPPGSSWRPYFWTRGALDLVLAQQVNGTAVNFAVIHVGYSSNPDLRAVVEPAPSGPPLLPTSAGSSYYDVWSVADVRRPSPDGSWPRVQTLQARDLVGSQSELNTSGLSAPGQQHDLSACMRPGETLIGPEGVPMTFVVAPETSSDQDGATIVFRARGGEVTAEGVVKGWCNQDATGGDIARYDLPESTYTGGTRFLGPIDQRSSLGLRGTDYSPEAELTVIAADGRETVVGRAPMRADLLAPGMTSGQFD